MGEWFFLSLGWGFLLALEKDLPARGKSVPKALRFLIGEAAEFFLAGIVFIFFIRVLFLLEGAHSFNGEIRVWIPLWGAWMWKTLRSKSQVFFLALFSCVFFFERASSQLNVFQSLIWWLQTVLFLGLFEAILIGARMRFMLDPPKEHAQGLPGLFFTAALLGIAVWKIFWIF